ncbi:Cytochrome P450 [Mycena sanguinolenta]|uniref:Cytochrome P450 n=1 Tax=Mycena sanguinolenta TaxID=230812 RepID=A0A8H6YAS7_9AGAR|nr:Cytochrome P450 [Mycena sanguinolenta]
MAKVMDLVFGFGRRLCPGKLFGEGNVFAIAATVLATCDIGPSVGGVEEVVYSSGSIRLTLVLHFRNVWAFGILTFNPTVSTDVTGLRVHQLLRSASVIYLACTLL